MKQETQWVTILKEWLANPELDSKERAKLEAWLVDAQRLRSPEEMAELRRLNERRKKVEHDFVTGKIQEMPRLFKLEDGSYIYECDACDQSYEPQARSAEPYEPQARSAEPYVK